MKDLSQGYGVRLKTEPYNTFYFFILQQTPRS